MAREFALPSGFAVPRARETRFLQGCLTTRKPFQEMASKKDKMLVVRMTEQEWQELEVYAETEDCKGGGSDEKDECTHY